MITPLPDSEKPGALAGYVADAVKKGAVVCNEETGGQGPGSFFFPVLLRNVPLTAEIAHQEQFGPIVPIVEFDQIEEVESYIFNSPYGLQASLFGQHPEELGRLIDSFSNQMCRINLNAQCQRGPDVYPFTGRKNSAEGTLSVTDALRAFSIRSMVATPDQAVGRQLVKNIIDGGYSRFLTDSKPEEELDDA